MDKAAELAQRAVIALLERDTNQNTDAILNDPDKTPAEKLLALLQNPFSGTLAAASMYSALGTSLGITAFTALAFSLMRPYNQAIYAPKVKHADERHAPPPVGKMPWSWITAIWGTKEEQLVTIIGMDATIFLRFTRMCRNMFIVLSIFGVGILAPVHITNFTKSTGEEPAWTSKITPLNVWDKPIWAQIVVAYLMNFTVIGFLWWNYRAVLSLRRKYFQSEDFQKSLHSRTLMLSDIPKKARSDEGIARIIDNVVPNSSFARTAVARNVKDLPNLIAQHDSAVRKLEKVLAKFLKDPNNVPSVRPTCKPSKKDRSYSTYPKGQKLDAIEYYTQRIRDLEFEVKEVRATVDKRGSMPFGFASYSDISEAHNIAYACRNKKPHGTTIVLAPRPNDIIWENMPLSSSARSRKRWINTLWIVILTFLWIAPNAMIAIFLVNLNNLGALWPAFKTTLREDAAFWGIVQGIGSPAIMSGFYVILPVIFRRLAMKAGDQTKTGRERHVTAKLYAFFVFNNLIIFSIFSVVWMVVSNLVDIIKDHKNAWSEIVKLDIASVLFISLCSNSTFWVSYLLQRQLGAAIDLAQLWPLVQAFFLKKFSSPTPRELIELTAPPPFEYAMYYNYFLYYATVTMCFAGIQPLVLLATALYFSIDVWLKKYLLLYRFVTKTESGGLYWRVVFNRLIFGTMLANLIVLLTCFCRGGRFGMLFYACCPLPFLMIIFKVYCAKTFDTQMKFYSATNVVKNPEAGFPKGDMRSERLASRFGHPALYKPLITPMVHARAQNLLPSVYKGRLRDGREVNAGDLMSVSGYSDMYALDAMQGGRPGKSAKADDVPGFEYVSENHLDFEYYKNRAEFADEHGGGEIFGRQGEIVRPGTPSSWNDGSDKGSRPGTPTSGRSTPFDIRRMNAGNAEGMFQPFPGPSSTAYGGFSQQTTSGEIGRNRSPLYSHDNGSSSGLGLIPNAAGIPMSTPMGNSRDASSERGTPGPSVGAMGGGPHGYSNLAQVENEGDQNPSHYDYFRSGNRNSRRPGEGW